MKAKDENQGTADSARGYLRRAEEKAASEPPDGGAPYDPGGRFEARSYAEDFPERRTREIDLRTKEIAPGDAPKRSVLESTLAILRSLLSPPHRRHGGTDKPV